MKKKDVLIISLLSVTAVLLVVLTFQLNSPAPAEGQTAGAGAGNYIIATGVYGGNGSCCWIFDAQNQKLVVYGITGTQLRGLVGARLCTYDFKLNEYPKQRPGVGEAKSSTNK